MLINDHFQNFKSYGIPKSQLVIADIPYNVGKNAYGSNPAWYKNGDNKNGESDLANKEFFGTDKNFRPAEFMHFCSKMMKKEPKQKGQAPCMIIFCAFDQQMYLIELAKKYGINKYINLVFRKNFSAQVLKANMRIVGNCEYGLLLYRDKLPKFNNNKKMIFNCIDWQKDTKAIHRQKIHPCLPAGERVFFDNKWTNIESVNIGQTNRYGKVIATSSHIAEKLVEILVGTAKTTATYNHPFLIKRKNKIYWINAENIKENDRILSKASVYYTQKPTKRRIVWNIKKQKKAILDMLKMNVENLGLNILLFGRNILGRSLWECKYIIKILTKQIIIFPIYKLSRHLNTNGCTLVVDLSMENGKNHVKFVDNLKKLIWKTGIIQEAGLTEKFAKNVTLKNQLKQEKFLLQKIGSVKIINKKTKVYNLTMDDIPSFDTAVGISHNTQKPINLLEKLIAIFTDEGDVVIDPVAGSGSTLIAAQNFNREGYGFEINKDFHKKAAQWIEDCSKQTDVFSFVREKEKKNNS